MYTITLITNVRKTEPFGIWGGAANGRTVRWIWATETWCYADTGKHIFNWEVAEDEDRSQHFLDDTLG